ncbi:ATP-binding cassette domain-containing protein [Streptomonospora sp. PA3]|uniref:ATP-binding cassette domain-containing protein n=1 Tax=Streptomonospora sp. PA3 TaxID=2607326 RepID=UPI00164362DF|nr:ATP-binding cassette domain-containing protein [Streptomonospora sp. PA3]
MDGSGPAVAAEGLRIVRGGRDAVRGVDFRIPPGEITGLLGPSGCGKSSLMRAVMGVQVVAEGRVTVLGRPAGHPALRRRVGYAAQTPSVYADLSVIENLRYFAAVLRAPRSDADRVLAETGLTDHAGHEVGRLSGGQRARASLAVALLGAPELLVLDEPTVGLDPVLREELWRLFHTLRDRGTSLLVSSHVMDEAGRCDRLLLMREGAIVAVETPAALRERTGTADLEQAFLRLIRGHATARADGAAAAAPADRGPGDGCYAGRHESRRAAAGVRPPPPQAPRESEPRGRHERRRPPGASADPDPPSGPEPGTGSRP